MLCPAVNLGRGAFEAMAHVVSLVHRSLEAAQDARGHCPLLAAYVHYAFRLPGTEPNFPSGKCWWEALGGGGRKYQGGERPSQREWHVQRPRGCTGLGRFGQLAREELWSLLLDWSLIQPVNKHLQ